MALNIKPVGDRIVVLPAPVEEKTKSGIFIPDQAKEKPQVGVIVAVGDGKDGEVMSVEIGDDVLYNKHSGIELTYEGITYLIMREADLFAII